MTEGNQKTMSQIEYHIDELKREKNELIKLEVEKKVDEFVDLLDAMPAENNEDLKRVLMMLVRDVKNIVEQ